MTNTLTAEQIAQGWKLHDGRNCPFRTNNHLCEVIDFDGIMHAGYGVSDQYAWVHEYRGPSDEIEAYCVWAYRTFSPDVPGPSESDALEALECLHTYALKTAATDSFYETHNQEMNEHMRVVRDVLASLPPPPVSGEADAEITRLTSQLEQAERVIAPFAEFVDCLDEELPDDEEYNTELGLEGYHSLTCGNFRAASQWIKDRQEKQALAELHTEEKHFGLE